MILTKKFPGLNVDNYLYHDAKVQQLGLKGVETIHKQFFSLRNLKEFKLVKFLIKLQTSK